MKSFRESQVYTAILLLFSTFIGGVTGYYVLGLANPTVSWSLFDCFYMTAISLTTVGYGEMLPGMDQYPAARVFTVFLLMFGTGILVYAASAGTAFIVEGDLGNFLEKRRMQRQIDALKGHYIICGAGTTGAHMIRELVDTAKPFVVIEMNEERIPRLKQLGATFVIAGDASADENLLSAGIKSASGLATCLPTDKDNLFVTITARQLNPELRIVSKNVEIGAREKLIRAGASAVVSPNAIGGLRLASELIRPTVVSFLDMMLRNNKALRFAEVTVTDRGDVAGLSLGDAHVYERVGIPVLAIRPKGGEFVFNPEFSYVLQPGDVMVVVGTREKVEALEQIA